MEGLFHLRDRARREGLRDRAYPGPADLDALLTDLAQLAGRDEPTHARGARRARRDHPCPARIDAARHAALAGSAASCGYCGLRMG